MESPPITSLRIRIRKVGRAACSSRAAWWCECSRLTANGVRPFLSLRSWRPSASVTFSIMYSTTADAPCAAARWSAVEPYSSALSAGRPM